MSDSGLPVGRHREMSENDCVVSLSLLYPCLCGAHETAKARSAGVTGIVANFVKGALVRDWHAPRRRDGTSRG